MWLPFRWRCFIKSLAYAWWRSGVCSRVLLEGEASPLRIGWEHGAMQYWWRKVLIYERNSPLLQSCTGEINRKSDSTASDPKRRDDLEVKIVKPRWVKANTTKKNNINAKKEARQKQRECIARCVRETLTMAKKILKRTIQKLINL